jgi:hypothetical protein
MGNPPDPQSRKSRRAAPSTGIGRARFTARRGPAVRDVRRLLRFGLVMAHIAQRHRVAAAARCHGAARGRAVRWLRGRPDHPCYQAVA